MPVTDLALDDPRWAAFVLSAPAATAFHHPSWATLLARCYHYRGFVVASTDDTGRITGGLPMIEVKVPLRGVKWVSLPFTDVCPPLGGGANSLAQIGSHLTSRVEANGPRRVEIRSDLGADAVTMTAGVIHRLRLEADPMAVFARFKKSQVQRNVRRAEKEGITVERSCSRSQLVDVFYDLHARTRRRQGVPVQPRRYFELLWEEMIEPGLGYVSVASVKDRAVATAVFLRWNGTTIYKYGASDAAAWPMRPNHLLFWDSIKASCESGDHTFDFGRTELDNEGLRSFKAGWAADEEALRYSLIGSQAGGGTSAVGSLAALARPVLRHAPLWSCRALGTLLYRYAA